MSAYDKFKALVRDLANISEHIDTEAAARSIRSNIYFRGPNVWILAFSIVIASVGLNVNSTAVIIGAMLVSPLMGPIIGVGLGLGVNDTVLIRDSVKNLLIMVVISLLASYLYFLVTPLRLANPTELLARTNPTIYDVIIALFGGAAGMFEMSRKEKGTVLSGVAIATALMPPLCTAGYGLANYNFQYFGGALLLFIINGVFIILATFIIAKALGFREVEFQDEKKAKRTRLLSAAIVVLVTIPSIWSAVVMIRTNRFSQDVAAFVAENRTLSSSYIYDYQTDSREGTVTLFITGGTVTAADRNDLYASAESHNLRPSQIIFKEHTVENGEEDASERLVKGIYERTDNEINKRDDEIRRLQAEISRIRKEEIPFVQIAREVSVQYPEITDLYLSRGASVRRDSTAEQRGVLVVASSASPLSREKTDRLSEWLKVRLADSSLVLINQVN